MEQGNYRLTLEKVGVDDDGDRVWENVIEVTDTPDGIVNAWLPTVSLRLGGELAPVALPSIPDVPAPDPQIQATVDVHATIAKRRRRTRAEIAADEAAKAAGYPSAAAMPVPAAGASVEHDTAQALKDAIPAQEDVPMASFENGPQAFPSAPAQAFNPFAAMQA